MQSAQHVIKEWKGEIRHNMAEGGDEGKNISLLCPTKLSYLSTLVSRGSRIIKVQSGGLESCSGKLPPGSERVLELGVHIPGWLLESVFQRRKGYLS